MREYKKYKGISYFSKGEYEIAKFLDEMKIDFEYEFPIAVVDSEKTKIWYPDFYLKEYQIVIEYFGMYNHNEAYKENADYKKGVFKNCGIQFLPVYELKDNWKEYILNTIATHLDFKSKKMHKNIQILEKNKTKLSTRIKKFFKKKPSFSKK